MAALDSRIQLVRREENGGISVASNDALALAKGEWVGFLDHDDLLEPDALFEIARLLQSHPDADLIYSDEDRLTEDGYEKPLLKPDWSPDYFLSYNYLCAFHLSAPVAAGRGRAGSSRNTMARRITICFCA